VGTSLSWWCGFHAIVIALIFIDARLHRGQNKTQRALSRLWVLLLAAVTVAFGAWVFSSMGRQAGLEFTAGYFIESALSVDNLFVFILILQSFHVCKYRQHNALFWGIAGAMVLRALFFVVGFSAFTHLRVTPVVCGVFLIYASWRMLHGEEGVVLPNWMRRFNVVSGSLIPAIIAIEVTDLIFATDSVPAVLSVSHNIFIAYTSNIAAILMLRSLYSGLSVLAERLQYLQYGVGVILAFIGIKMIAGPWLGIPITISLLVIGAALGISAAASLLFARHTREVPVPSSLVASGCKTPVCTGQCVLN
jgi:tellurite resistance protein TerC